MTRFSVLAASMIALLGVTTPSFATLFSYSTFLDGISESPPNASPATGSAVVDYNDALHTLRVQVSFSGLLGPSSASHIHAATTVPGSGTAGVATLVPAFPGFPLGVTSGSDDATLDLTLATSWNGSYITNNGGTTAGAEAALAAAMAAGKAYLNVHSQVFPGGEIRGFLTPEPTTLGLAAVGTLAMFRRRRTAR